VLSCPIVLAEQTSSLGSRASYTAPLLLGSAFLVLGMLFVYYRRQGIEPGFAGLSRAYPWMFFTAGLSFCIVAFSEAVAEDTYAWVTRLLVGAAAWVVVLLLGLESQRRYRLFKDQVDIAATAVSQRDNLLEVNARLQEEIAARSIVEEELAQSEQELRLALNAGQMGVWEWDFATDKIRLDERMRELWGFDPAQEEVDSEAIFTRVHPDDIANVQDRIDTAITLRENYHCEFKVVFPDQSVHWLEGTGTVLYNDQGQPVRMVGMNFDTTQRRESDEHLRLNNRALEAATNGILITTATDAECRIVYANRGFELLTGYTAAEVMGRNCEFLQGPLTEHNDVANIRNSLLLRQSCDVTLQNYRKDGTPFWNELRISPLRDDRGLVTHFVGVMSDATERKQFEESLRLAQLQAESANQAKSAFLANMSHEIRTPLTAVLGCAETLYPRVADDEQREMVQMIRNQGQMLLGILNDVLDLSKIEAGKLEIHPQPCALHTVIEEVRSLFQPLAADRGIELISLYPKRMPRKITTDTLRVRQILVNLVGNAVKFTERGKVTIQVLLPDSQPNFVRIEVRDTGVGIPKEKLRHIFTAFNQEHRHLSQKYGGTGLGLTICLRLIELLHGRIYAESEPGQGSCLSFELPITEAESKQLASSVEMIRSDQLQIQQHESSIIQIPLRVLVAEDTRSIQFLIRRMLEDVKAHVTLVNNGQEALEMLQKYPPGSEPFDLILMDMQMPVLNGFETTAKLRAEGYTLPIVALTAAALQGDRERCLEAGCNEYLPKPLDRQQLFILLASYYDELTPGSNTAITSME
jgi:PAS domain S-box-containing protein